MPKLRKMLGDVNGEACATLMKQMETQSVATLVRWSADFARTRLLPLVQNGDTRPQEALDAVDRYLAGEITKNEAKPFLKAAREAAKDATDPVTEAAVRGIGTATSVLLTPTNGLGYLFYGAAAIAYHTLGTEDSPASYDIAAEGVFREATEALVAISVPAETKPAKLNWNC